MKTEAATQLPECIEGPEAARQFDEGVRRIFSVPHSTLARRERTYKKKSSANPMPEHTGRAKKTSSILQQNH